MAILGDIINLHVHVINAHDKPTARQNLHTCVIYMFCYQTISNPCKYTANELLHGFKNHITDKLLLLLSGEKPFPNTLGVTQPINPIHTLSANHI